MKNFHLLSIRSTNFLPRNPQVSLGCLAEGGRGLYSSSSGYPGTLYCTVCTVNTVYKYLYVNTVCILYTCISIQDLDTVLVCNICISILYVYIICIFKPFLFTVSTSCIYDIIYMIKRIYILHVIYIVTGKKHLHSKKLPLSRKV